MNLLYIQLICWVTFRLYLSFLLYFKIYRIKYFVYHAESSITNISHQLFDYKITYLNSQHDNTISRDDFVLKNGLNIFLKISGIQK